MLIISRNISLLERTTLFYMVVKCPNKARQKWL